MDMRTLMARSARFYSEREAVVWRDRRLTFGEAWKRGLRMANALLALGLKPGDRVGVLEDNSIEASDMFLGAAAANIVRVPLYPRNAREAHVHMLSHTDCRVLVVSGKHAAEAAGLLDEVPSLEHVLIRDEGYEDWLARQDDSDPEVDVDADDLFIIRHTGGTTGLPKGVSYTHRAWLAAGRDWHFLFPPIMPGDKCLHIGPISHASGYSFVPVWLSGGCNVLLDHFDAGDTLDIMEQEEISIMFAVPTMVNTLVHHPGVSDRKFPKLKCMQIGAAPITETTALKAHGIFGHRLWQVYGQTEAVPLTVMGPDQWFAEVEGSRPLQACGMPLPFADLKICDEHGNEVPLGEEGELVARCDGQMTGFWKDPEATAERMIDGWVRTGDIGRIDENGYVYMLDRAGDMIVSGGFNIYPAEIENALASHPAVIEAAVFGIPSARWGESPMGVCVIDGKTPVTEEELIQLCVDRLGSYKRPAKIEMQTDPLPRSPVGKVKRKDLREPHWRGQSRRVAGN